MKYEPDDPEVLNIGAPTETRYDELSLWTVQHARASDPQTSTDAAESMRSAAEIQKRHIYDALVCWGPATADECDHRLGWRPTTAGRRMKDLIRDGLVERTDDKRLTRSGRWSHVYRVKQSKGEAA